MLRLWCYDDAHNWGKMLHEAAIKRGHDAHLFDDPRAPQDGFVFMHMHHHPSVRLLHKRMMAIMAMNADLTLIPDYRSSVLYDDKLEQARQLARYMPRTRVFYTPGASRRFLDSGPILPFMSKSLDGASSHNVRFVETYDAAKLEIRQAFSDLGIKCRYSQVQRGYLMWQDFIPGNEGDVRIAAIGNKRLILRRGNFPDRPMASGNGKLTPIISLEDPEIMAALFTANEFFAAENLKWSAVDMIRDQVGRWYILEITVGWTLHGYYECTFIDCRPTAESGCPRLMTKVNGEAHEVPITGQGTWEMLIDEIEAGIF